MLSKNLRSGCVKKVWIFLKRYCLFFIPLIILTPGIDAVPFPGSGAAYTDLLISHYPNAIYFIKSLTQGGTFPLWSDNILSGYPYLANPLSGIWYPIGYLGYIFPFPLGINLLIGIHLAWGGIGLYRLLRCEGVARPAAYFGSVAFSILPKFFSHFGAGHISLMYAVSWTPWILQSECKLLKSGNSDWKARIAPGALIGVTFLADPRWVAYAILMWVGYKIAHSHIREFRRLLIAILANGAVALSISAPVLFPFIEFTHLTTRASLLPTENLVGSLPVVNLFGIILPDPQVYHEWSTYLGGTVFILGLSTILFHRRNCSISFWSIVFLISLVFALGEKIPINYLVAELPGMNLIRIPSRVLFLTGLSGCALAGHGASQLLHWKPASSARAWRLVIFALSLFSAMLILGKWSLHLGSEWKIAWGLASVVAGGLWINLRFFARIKNQAWIGGILILVVIDLAAIDRLSFITHSSAEVFKQGEEVAEYLSSQKSLFRTYSPSYSLPQQTTARFGLQLSDGIDPLQLSSYVEYMVAATGVSRSEYSVTLPEFINGDPKTDNRNAIPNPELLGRLNVAYILADFDLKVDGLILERQFGETRVYRNLKARPRAWVQSSLHDMTDSIKKVNSIEWYPNRVEIEATGPGYLILSEIHYPGWRVWVDGNPRQLLTPDGILRAVELDSGQHRIIFTFRPLSFYLGFSLSGLAMIGLLLHRFTLRQGSGKFNNS